MPVWRAMEMRRSASLKETLNDEGLAREVMPAETMVETHSRNDRWKVPNTLITAGWNWRWAATALIYNIDLHAFSRMS